MTDKQRGAVAATMWCLAIIFGVMTIHAAWDERGVGVAVGILFGASCVIMGYLTWSAET